MILSEWVFVAIVCFTAGSALLAVLARSLIHALLGLVALMFGVGGLYVFLAAPFLAMMQILIYVGAVSILMAFAIMLAGPFFQKPTEWGTRAKFLAASGVALFTFLVGYIFVIDSFPAAGRRPPVPTHELGQAFFGPMILPFELISLIIVVAIIGAIMLALYSQERK
jgi:NADH-quinone oxidoreductase subunit J